MGWYRLLCWFEFVHGFTLGKKGIEGTESIGEASSTGKRQYCEKAEYTYASANAGYGQNPGSSMCTSGLHFRITTI